MLVDSDQWMSVNGRSKLGAFRIFLSSSVTDFEIQIILRGHGQNDQHLRKSPSF